METLTDPTLATDPRWADPFAAPPTASETTPGTGELAILGPNPVRGSATLTVRLPAPADVRLDVFSVTGRRIATLVNGRHAGKVSARWDASGLPAGVYLARLTADGAVTTRTFTVIR